MFNNNNDLQIAWLAGLFDGEGSVGFYRRSAPRNKTGVSYYIVASIAMTHAPTIRLVAEMFSGAGWVKFYKKDKCRNCFHWRLQNAKARAFLEAILPYSVTKRDEIIMALAADDIRAGRVGKRSSGKHDSLTESDMQELDTHVSNLKLLKRKEYAAEGN